MLYIGYIKGNFKGQVEVSTLFLLRHAIVCCKDTKLRKAHSFQLIGDSSDETQLPCNKGAEKIKLRS